MSLPNLLTFSRIVAVPLILYLLYSGYYPAAVAVFLLSAATDAVDGFLARKLDQATELGKFLDPLADKVLVISILLALIELRSVPALPVILITARELLVTAMRTSGARILGKLKTVSQVIALPLLMLDAPYALLALWAAVTLTLVSGADQIARR